MAPRKPTAAALGRCPRATLFDCDDIGAHKRATGGGLRHSSHMTYSGAQPPDQGNPRRRLGAACMVGLLVSLACVFLIWMTYKSLPPDLKMISLPKVGLGPSRQ
jgi:hypothetical protein